jgi:Allene oxide cyclase barrel like domain
MRGTVRLFIGAGSIAAVALVVSFVSVSVAGPNVTRLEVVEHATTDTVIDLTTNGDSTGDLLTFHNELCDAANTDVVGSNQGECVRIEVGVSWECRWVNVLEGGSITVEGPFFDAGSSALAITGGTGAYRGARGSMRLVPSEVGTEFTFVFRILLG